MGARWKGRGGGGEVGGGAGGDKVYFTGTIISCWIRCKILLPSFTMENTKAQQNEAFSSSGYLRGGLCTRCKVRVLAASWRERENEEGLLVHYWLPLVSTSGATACLAMWWMGLCGYNTSAKIHYRQAIHSPGNYWYTIPLNL